MARSLLSRMTRDGGRVSMTPVISSFSLERVVNAVESVRRRPVRATKALTAAEVPYAVVGGNAVAHWVSRVDQSAVRNTPDVGILIRREDLDRARRALEGAGFVYRHADGVDFFLDTPQRKVRDAVRLVMANDNVLPDVPFPNPDVTESEEADQFRVLALEALVRMNLAAFRDRDRVHLRDLIGVRLINWTWTARLPPELAERLQSLLDTAG